MLPFQWNGAKSCYPELAAFQKKKAMSANNIVVEKNNVEYHIRKGHIIVHRISRRNEGIIFTPCSQIKKNVDNFKKLDKTCNRTYNMVILNFNQFKS